MTDAVSKRWLYWLIPAGIVLLGLVLRLYQIERESLWYDELFSLAASRLPMGDMHPLLVKDLVHPPLHYYVLHAWFGAFGVSVWQARLVSAIFGALSVLALYALARYLFDSRVASVSALLMAVSQIGVRYSQEARPYAQIFALVVIASALFLKALRTRRALYWWLFVAAAVLTVGTHYYGLFAVASFVLFAWIYRRRYPLPATRWIGGFVILAAVFAAWLASGVLREALQSPKIAVGPTSQHWYSILTVVNTFNNGRVNGFPEAAPVWTLFVGGLLFTLPALIALRNEQSDRENRVFLLILAAVPVVLALAAGAVLRYYDVRYVAFSAAPYYILVARGAISLNSRFLRGALVLLTIAYSVYALRANYFLPSKENLRDPLAYVAAHSKAGDCYVAGPLHEERPVRWAWSIYMQGRPELVTTPLDSVVAPATTCGRVWLISVMHLNHPPHVRWCRESRQLLAAHYSLADRKSYFWTELDLYARNGSGAISRRMEEQ